MPNKASYQQLKFQQLFSNFMMINHFSLQILSYCNLYIDIKSNSTPSILIARHIFKEKNLMNLQNFLQSYQFWNQYFQFLNNFIYIKD
jgi:hypothetical protein